MLEIVALKDAKLTDFRVEAERWRANGHWLPGKNFSSLVSVKEAQSRAVPLPQALIVAL